MAENEKVVHLQVAGSNERDVGKGTARLPASAFAALGIEHGAIVESFSA